MSRVSAKLATEVTESTENTKSADYGRDQLTAKIIGAAIEVHRILGPGLLESVYEHALCYEFELRDIRYQRQACIEMVYKGNVIKDQRIDFIVEESRDRLVVD
ncbi:MAG TPA: GxxExxY protein [Lacipirellulaceae bacterium]|nr:GxxExxY protein [Lacipirellulaceae bacterium]